MTKRDVLLALWIELVTRLNLNFELFHEIIQIALCLRAVSEWPDFIAFTNLKIPEILLAKNSLAAVNRE
ncbi:MAG: hypothetical protein COA96_00910 [SAR86 cluster bacterium]|uniref:Uncharacterized protein n=1 Tax=SAR86 cluster bacterium TaxID=2030880 RepID=A0A2A5BAF5_9GAMM|nr:MAG: hypothetical protein COA96_00910 [SAR86 cluster bacterium]